MKWWILTQLVVVKCLILWSKVLLYGPGMDKKIDLVIIDLKKKEPFILEFLNLAQLKLISFLKLIPVLVSKKTKLSYILTVLRYINGILVQLIRSWSSLKEPPTVAAKIKSNFCFQNAILIHIFRTCCHLAHLRHTTVPPAGTCSRLLQQVLAAVMGCLW